MAHLPHHLDRLRKLAQVAGIKLDVATGVLDTDEEIPVLLLRHANHVVTAHEDGAQIVAAYSLDLDEGDGAMLDKLPRDKRENFFGLLRRELLDGRSGFRFVWKDMENKQTLVHIRVEQRLVIEAADAATKQRLLDAMQELVNLGVRAQSVLSATFREIIDTTSSTSATSADGMYN